MNCIWTAAEHVPLNITPYTASCFQIGRCVQYKYQLQGAAIQQMHFSNTIYRSTSQDKSKEKWRRARIANSLTNKE